ncbi:hypothetical protein EYR40_006824 [Pleurotus pulmonarius]|nr:hypothetical protein EYR36_003889 [Pleurotus pulmonarius]KAF4599725.1 hypothetical protein EYR40_006824 [Pleurotus pulmonarius]
MSLSPLQSPPALLIPPPVEYLQESSDTSRNTSSERKHSPLRKRNKKASEEFARLLTQGLEGSEVRNLQRVLNTVNEQLRVEKVRADEAEKKVFEVLVQLRRINDEKNAALREAATAKENVNQYKLRLEQAQNEIFRAQDILKIVDGQRLKAEKMAAKDRSTAHKLREENLVYLAREEGRKQGMKEGFERGRDMGYHEGYARGHSAGRYEDDEEEEEYYDTGDEADMSPLSDESQEYDDPPPPPPRDRNARASSVPPVPIPPPSNSGSNSRLTPRRSGVLSPDIPIHVPPESDIPLSGRDSYIHLPPPHEYNRPPTMPPVSSTRPSSRGAGEETPLRVPPPAPESVRSRRSVRSMRSMDRIRRSSPESNSTTISQLEMVNHPGSSFGHSPMSIIPEVLSAQASPNPSTLREAASKPSIRTPAISVTRVPPSPRTAIANLAELEQLAMRGVYTRTRSNSSSSQSSSAKKSRAPSGDRRNSQASMNTVPDINIEPPSRPPSMTRRSSSEIQAPPRRMGDLLSPEDANRIRVLPPESSTVRDSAPSSTLSNPPEAGSASGATPIVLADGQLPAFFVPTTFTPAVPQHNLLPPLFEATGGTGSGMPGGLNYPDSGAPVIPDGSLRRANLDESTSSSSSDSLDSDANTLTTPPPRSRTPLTSYTGTSRLSAAGVPLPPSTVSGTPRTNASYLYNTGPSAAGVPLPPSTVSGTPRTSASYLYNPVPDSEAPSRTVKRAPSKASTVRTSRSRRDDSSTVESSHRHGGDDDRDRSLSSDDHPHTENHRGRDDTVSSDDHPHTESHHGLDDSTSFSLTSTPLTATSVALSGQVTPAPVTSTDDRGRDRDRSGSSSDDHPHSEDRNQSASSDDRHRGQDDSTTIASATALSSPSAVPAGQTSLSPALATAPANAINGASMSAASVTGVVTIAVIVSSFMTAGFGL